RRELYRMTIFRVITALQLLVLLDSTFNLLAIHINPTNNASCRVFTFFSLVFAISPLVLSVNCILYFQIILIHNIPLRKKWPRVLMAVASVVLSVVPEMFTLIVPPRTAGMTTYCDFYGAPSKRLFVLKWLVFYIWVSLVALIGLSSIFIMIVHIVKRTWAAQDQMSTDGFEHSDDSFSVYSLNADVIADVVKDNRQKRRRSSNSVVVHTLRSVIWFPIAPIVCMGFNTVYSIVWYRTQKENNAIFIVDRVLQFLSVPLIAMTFYLSPPVRRAFKQYLADRRSIAASKNQWHLEEIGARRSKQRRCQSARCYSHEDTRGIHKRRSFHYIKSSDDLQQYQQQQTNRLPPFSLSPSYTPSHTHSFGSRTLHTRNASSFSSADIRRDSDINFSSFGQDDLEPSATTNK
ncbi:hypothetical protein GGI05_004759, partial [Coemansia sp. RSA 2603]